MWLRSIGLIALLAFAGCSPRGQSRENGPKAQTREQSTIVRTDPVRPFPQAKELRLFVDTGTTDRGGNVIYARPHGLKLTSGQRSDFEKLLRIETPIKVPDSYYWVASCFIPHHFFRYYDGSGRQVGEISVCFCCAGVEMEPSASLHLNPEQRFEVDYGKLKLLVSSWGERTTSSATLRCHSGSFRPIADIRTAARLRTMMRDVFLALIIGALVGTVCGLIGIPQPWPGAISGGLSGMAVGVIFALRRQRTG